MTPEECKQKARLFSKAMVSLERNKQSLTDGHITLISRKGIEIMTSSGQT
jgi:hypothetical protein